MSNPLCVHRKLALSDFDKFKSIIESTEFNLQQNGLPEKLKINDDGVISTYYAPFDYINEKARVVFCGITPGFQQAILALKEASIQLRRGADADEAKRRAKNTGALPVC